MPSASQSSDGRDSVRVIGCGDDYSINILLVHEPPKIVVGFRLRKFLSGGIEEFVVYIAESDDVFARYAVEILRGAIMHANHADVQLFIGSRFSRAGERSGEEEAGGGKRSAQ